MEDEPERGTSASSSTAVTLRGGSSEAGTSSSSTSSSSNASQVRGAEEIHGGRFPSGDWVRDREVEEEQRRIGHSHGGVDSRVSDGGESPPIIGDETWSCVIVLVTFWFFVSMTLILGVYGSVTLQLGPNSSILLQPSPIFVQSVKVEEQSESKTGSVLYGLYQTPALDVIKIWSETHNVSVSTDSYKDLMYYLNEGSQINISYTVYSPSSSIFLIIAKGSEGLAQWLDNPAYPNTTLSWNIIRGSGVICQDILTSSSYYVAVGNLNSDDSEVQLHLGIKSTLYNTSKAYYKCNLTQGSCSMSVLFPDGNAAVLTSLGPEQALYGHGLYVKLSYGPRWVTYILGIGVMTVLMLFAFNFLNNFQSSRGVTGSSHEQIRSEREPLISRKDDDLSSWGSSYDSLPHDEDDLEDLLAIGSQEGKSLGDGENGNNTRRLCAICFDAPRDCFFLPCGHCVACFACGTRIVEADGTCPICRRKMKKVRKIFTV